MLFLAVLFALRGNAGAVSRSGCEHPPAEKIKTYIKEKIYRQMPPQALLIKRYPFIMHVLLNSFF